MKRADKAAKPSPKAGFEPSNRLCLFLLAAFPVIVFWPSLFGGQMLWAPDIQALEFVFKTAAYRSLDLHEWPLWMPEILCGMPGIAASNLIFLHPVELLLCLARVPAWMTFGLEATVEVALCGIGLYVLLQRFKLSRSACLVAAFAYAASGTMLALFGPGHVNNTKGVAMLPWVFWGALKGWEEDSLKGWAFCGLALAWQVLGMALQIFAYDIIALGFWVAWLAASGFGAAPAAPWRKAFIGLGVAGVIGFLLSAPQLLSSLLYKPYSWREGFTYEQFVSWSFHPKEALGWIVPGFFGWREPTYHGDWPFSLTTEYFGLLPWALATVALVVAKARSLAPGASRVMWQSPEAFFLSLAVFSFLAGMGKYFPLHLVFYHLPIYNGFRTWARFLSVLTFSVCVLAGFGWQALQANVDGLARKAALGFVGFAGLVALASIQAAPAAVHSALALLTPKLGPTAEAVALGLATDSAWRALGVAAVLAVLFWNWEGLRKMPALLFLAFVALHAWDSSVVSQRYVGFRAPRELLTKPAFLNILPSDSLHGEPFRLYDQEGLWAQNTAALFGYETVEGYHGVQMAAPMKLRQALAKRPVDWLNLCNARYFISQSPVTVPGWKTLATAPYVYENIYALPRAYLVGAATQAKDDDDAFKLLALPGFDVRNSVTVNAVPGVDGKPALGQVAWDQRGRNAQALTVSTVRPALLVLSQTWYPDWQAWVDGKAQPLLKADGGALQALHLDPGTHSVRLQFSGRTLYTGFALAGLGLLALVFLWRRETHPA